MIEHGKNAGPAATAPKPPTTAVCCGCGATEAESVARDLGWRFQTQVDSVARWLCVTCLEPEEVVPW